MKHLMRLSIILGISLLGELLNSLIPLPVPAGIYGLILMLAGLMTRIIPLDAVRTPGHFLIEIMPVMFIPAAVGLMDSWPMLRPMLPGVAAAVLIVTLAVMAISGWTTQLILRAGRKREEGRDHGDE